MKKDDSDYSVIRHYELRLQIVTHQPKHLDVQQRILEGSKPATKRIFLRPFKSVSFNPKIQFLSVVARKDRRRRPVNSLKEKPRQLTGTVKLYSQR